MDGDAGTTSSCRGRTPGSCPGDSVIAGTMDATARRLSDRPARLAMHHRRPCGVRAGHPIHFQRGIVIKHALNRRRFAAAVAGAAVVALASTAVPALAAEPGPTLNFR